MKILPLPVIVAGAIALGSVTAFADSTQSVKVTGSAQDLRLSMDDRAINSCFQEFISEILPGSAVNVRTINEAGSGDIFSPHDPMRNKKMLVTMEALSSEDGTILASAKCKVDRNAKISSLKTKVKDSERLANLTAKDLRFVASLR